MATRNEDLQSNAPDAAMAALLCIDVINDLEFADGEALLQYALPMARRLAGLKKQAQQAGIPVVYVSDNFGRWRSDLKKIVSHCLQDNIRGRPLVELLQPEEDDYFVLKPKHSGFFSTTLDLLLDYRQTRILILTGIVGNVCVLFTANDAYRLISRSTFPPIALPRLMQKRTEALWNRCRKCSKQTLDSRESLISPA